MDNLQHSLLVKFLNDNGLTPSVLLENNNARFANLWFPNYFRMDDPTTRLDFATIVGQDRLEALATIVSRESEFPKHSRQGLDKIKAEIPSIGVGRKLNAQELRDIRSILNDSSLSTDVKLTRIINNIVEDMLYCRNSVLRRVDSMVKQLVSTGSVDITTDNNPNGIVFNVPIVDEGNISDSAGDWTNPDFDIIEEIEKEFEVSDNANRPVDKILIKRSLFSHIKRNKSVQKYYEGYLNQRGKAIVNLESINETLTANMLPIFEIVDDKAVLQIDGVNENWNAWNGNNAVFVPGGELGIIHNAYADEELSPVEGIDYSLSDRVLLSRWRERKPLAEITEGEINAFPGFEAAKSVRIKKVVK